MAALSRQQLASATGPTTAMKRAFSWRLARPQRQTNSILAHAPLLSRSDAPLLSIRRRSTRSYRIVSPQLKYRFRCVEYFSIDVRNLPNYLSVCLLNFINLRHNNK